MIAIAVAEVRIGFEAESSPSDRQLSQQAKQRSGVCRGANIWKWLLGFICHWTVIKRQPGKQKAVGKQEETVFGRGDTDGETKGQAWSKNVAQLLRNRVNTFVA